MNAHVLTDLLLFVVAVAAFSAVIIGFLRRLRRKKQVGRGFEVVVKKRH